MKYLLIAIIIGCLFIGGTGMAKAERGKPHAAAVTTAGTLTVSPNPVAVGGDVTFQLVGATPGTNVPWTLAGSIDDAGGHAGSFVIDVNGNSATYMINAMYAGSFVLSASGIEPVTITVQ
jgi:hypothetical protein